MPTILQFRRGTTAQNDNYTGSVGELTIDTDLDTLRIHDGSSAGGHTMPSLVATQTFTNKTLTAPVISGGSVNNTTIGASTASSGAFTTLSASSTAAFSGGVTIGSDSLAEYIADTVGAMVTSNTESGIAVTYDDTDNTLDFDVGDFDITLTGAVTGTGTVTNLGSVSIATTATNDFDITLTGAVTGTGTVTNLGSVSIATTATNDPIITLAGDLSGSCTLTNLGNATLTATIVANSVALGTDTTGNYVASGATSGNGISGSVASEGGTFTVTSNATSANTANTIVYRDASGNFSAGVVTATSTSARYADLAEKYTSDLEYSPGTVVVFGGPYEVTESTKSHDSAVAGVVSTDPAYLMNSDLKEGVAVALTGRVPCIVKGPVNKGTVLVTSDVPGAAEAINYNKFFPGVVIGKSLEEIEDDSVKVIEIAVGRF